MKDLTHRVEEEAATVGLDISRGLPTRHSLVHDGWALWLGRQYCSRREEHHYT